MIERTAGDLAYFQFRNLARRPAIRHGIMGRQADSALFPDGLNLSFYTSDRPESVVAARRQACAALGIQLDQLVVPQQAHGSQVAVVAAEDRGRGALDRDSALPETDALVSAQPGIALFVSAADCVPLLFYDPKRKAIGAAHAGWRGTAARVAARTVHKMADAFGTKPGDLYVGIGPAIGPCCYTVGDDVVRVIGAALGAIGGLFSARPNGELTFDLWQTNIVDLMLSGVQRENIELAELCTACNNEKFFSQRAEQGRAGRFGAFIGLVESAGRAANG